jgi:glycosyltransferase involved in cell wall biosynthesis
MTPMRRIAFIGNHLPRRCGIATFTHDIHLAVATTRPDLDTSVVAMTDHGRNYQYPPPVRFQIRDGEIGDYIKAAEFLNRSEIDVVSLQHEYGIFGGQAGGHVIELLSRLEMPIVTTLHTVLDKPSPSQREVIGRIIQRSTKVIVMSEKGREILRSVHDVPSAKIGVIPHGIPDFPFREPDHAKAKLGFGGKMVILTFGLLSPSKGIETVIDAMPEIIKSCPNAIYVVLGATHPNLVRNEGEAYRDSLTTRVRELGVEDHVVFFNQFADQATLLDFISMCDVYVTPYLNESQMTSGTLAYSFGLGKAVVSTPYWHAQELLDDGLGILVPFRDPSAMSVEISGLLTDDIGRLAIRKRAYAESRSMTWAETAKRYLSVFEESHASVRPGIAPVVDPVVLGTRVPEIPEVNVAHFLSLCDSTGMLQHAVHAIADRAHGYCIDDNARALLFATALSNSGETQLPEIVIARFAAFIQHAWNPDTRRFRNFMSYDRRWLEEKGSEDSHGRTLWALGECARRDADSSRRKWAAGLFKTALPAVEEFSSPRAWAFALLGLDGYCAGGNRDLDAHRVRKVLADRLCALFAACESKDWVWFEDVLAYDNARLPQALIQTGSAINVPAYVEVGLRSLRWLMSLQTTSLGYFRPVGTRSFGRIRQKPEAFDQQALEASATISACYQAGRVDDAMDWPAAAMRAFGWFLGRNDLKASLVDLHTGSCSDGLHPDRVNENKGAESVLSYLLGLGEIRQFERRNAIARSRPEAKPVRSAVDWPISRRATPGGHLVSIPIFESPDLVSSAGPGPGGG